MDIQKLIWPVEDDDRVYWLSLLVNTFFDDTSYRPAPITRNSHRVKVTIKIK